MDKVENQGKFLSLFLSFSLPTFISSSPVSFLEVGDWHKEVYLSLLNKSLFEA